MLTLLPTFPVTMTQSEHFGRQGRDQQTEHSHNQMEVDKELPSFPQKHVDETDEHVAAGIDQVALSGAVAVLLLLLAHGRPLHAFGRLPLRFSILPVSSHA